MTHRWPESPNQRLHAWRACAGISLFGQAKKLNLSRETNGRGLLHAAQESCGRDVAVTNGSDCAVARVCVRRG